MPTAPGRQAHESCVKLESKLRAWQREKGFYEPSVRAIRAQLREAYCTLMLCDYMFALVGGCIPGEWVGRGWVGYTFALVPWRPLGSQVQSPLQLIFSCTPPP